MLPEIGILIHKLLDHNGPLLMELGMKIKKKTVI